MPSTTVREIAERAGFSVAAVSKTLNSVEGTIRIGDETRKKILAAARSLCYRPNDDIGLLVTPDYSYLDPLTARVLQGVQFEAQNRHSHVLCGLMSDGALPQLVRESCVGGVLFLHRAPEAMTSYLNDRGLPYVVINPDVETENDCILCDDYKGMTDALAHLYKQGCRRFVFVWEVNEHPSYVKRRKAFTDFVTRRKLEHVIIETPPDAATGKQIREWLRDPQQTGFIIWEELFPFILAQAERSQLKQLRIVTVNDLLSALFIPRVTSVRVPFLEMGREAVRMLIRKWNDNHAPMPTVTVQPELICRESEF